MGIPGVSIVQEKFVENANKTTEAFGLLNPALAVTPYVFTSLNPEQTRQAVDDKILEDIIRGLTKPITVESRESRFQRVPARGPKDDVLEFGGSDYRECFDKMNDSFAEWGWSDGFPTIPPTEEAVEAMLRGTKLSPDHLVVEKFVPGMAEGTVKNIAINAVMAGGKPELLPVVITALKAMHDSVVPLRMMAMSTGPHAPLFIVNGPVADKLRINSGMCALGPAGPEKLSLANVVIGRAVRLCLMNVGGAYPGIMDMDTIGSPTKFGMVLAENEKANPWNAHHVERGFRPEDSTVSCCYGYSLVEMGDLVSDTAEDLLSTFAKHLMGICGMQMNTYIIPVILLAPAHAGILARDGWSKEDIRQYLHLHCMRPAEDFRRSPYFKNYVVKMKWLQKADSKAMVHLLEKPEDIHIVVVGGQAGKSAVYGGYHPVKPHLLEN